MPNGKYKSKEISHDMHMALSIPVGGRSLQVQIGDDSIPLSIEFRTMNWGATVNWRSYHGSAHSFTQHHLILTSYKTKQWRHHSINALTYAFPNTNTPFYVNIYKQLTHDDIEDN